MRTLVTGGAGFIGSHVVDALLDAGDEVAIVDDLSHPCAGSRIAGGPNFPGWSTVDRFRVSITDPAFMPIVRRFGPHRIVHCAAQVSVLASMRDPVRDHLVNTIGTERVVTSAPGAHVVFLSSGGAIYGQTTRAARETDLPRPISPYGKDKQAAEAWLQTTTGTWAILRLSNVYGPRQQADGEAAAIPGWLAAGQAGSPITLFGHGAQRDFVHVSDVVAAVMLGLERRDRGLWNISTGIGTEVRSVAELISAHYGVPIEQKPAREGEVRISVLDPTFARQSLGWEARVNLQAGLAALW